MPVIGVIGHRALGDPGRLVAGIDEAFDRIRSRFDGQPLVLIASLVEGADRLVVARAFERLPISTFVVPLPFARREFEAEFQTPGSLEEFRSLVARAQYVLQLPPPHGTPREDAYAEAGRFIIGRAHVLVVVWNGRRDGGKDATGYLVALARACGIPIAWVHAYDGADADTPSPALRAPGSVAFEGW